MFKPPEQVVEQTQVSSKYPEIVQACQKQGIHLHHVFAKVVNNGPVTEASYPMVELNGSDEIPTTDDHSVVYDAGKLKAANMLAKMHGDNTAIKAISK